MTWPVALVRKEINDNWSFHFVYFLLFTIGKKTRHTIKGMKHSYLEILHWFKTDYCKSINDIFFICTWTFLFSGLRSTPVLRAPWWGYLHTVLIHVRITGLWRQLLSPLTSFPVMMRSSFGLSWHREFRCKLQQNSRYHKVMSVGFTWAWSTVGKYLSMWNMGRVKSNHK